MSYLFFILLFEGIVCAVIQLYIIKILRSRFPQKWIEWGQPHPFSSNTKAGKIFINLVMSDSLIELGDLELSKAVWWMRYSYKAFKLTFAVCVALFLISLVKSHWK